MRFALTLMLCVLALPLKAQTWDPTIGMWHHTKPPTRAVHVCKLKDWQVMSRTKHFIRLMSEKADTIEFSIPSGIEDLYATAKKGAHLHFKLMVSLDTASKENPPFYVWLNPVIDSPPSRHHPF